MGTKLKGYFCLDKAYVGKYTADGREITTEMARAFMCHNKVRGCTNGFCSEASTITPHSESGDIGQCPCCLCWAWTFGLCGITNRYMQCICCLDEQIQPYQAINVDDKPVEVK